MSKKAEREAFHKEWLEQAKPRDSKDLGKLLAGLTQLGTSAQIAERIVVLGRWPRDARIAQTLVKLVEEPPFISASTRTLWIQLFFALMRHGDESTASSLGHNARSVSSRFDQGMRFWIPFWCQHVADHIERRLCLEPPFDRSDVGTNLDAALSAIRESQWSEALDKLLALWKHTRWSVIGDAIDVIGDRVAEKREAIPGRHRHQIWMERIEDFDHRDVPHLLAVITKGYESQCLKRIETLFNVPEDPRIANFACQAILNPPYPPFSSTALAIESLTMIHADPRSIDVIRSTEVELSCTSLAPEFIEDELQRIQPPEPTKAQEEQLNELRQRLGLTRRSADSAQKEELLDAVYATPSDDDTRLVYADCLSEQGDPRGEFIQLQYARQASSNPARISMQERKLFKAHFADWVEGLEPVLRKPGTSEGKRTWFERGFLTSAVIRRPSVAVLKSRLEDRGWATIEELHLEENSQQAIASSQLTSLKWLSGLSLLTNLPARLIDRMSPNLETLEIGLFIGWQPPGINDPLINAVSRRRGIRELRFREWTEAKPTTYASTIGFRPQLLRRMLEDELGKDIHRVGAFAFRDPSVPRSSARKSYGEELGASLSQWMSITKELLPNLENHFLYLGPSSRDPILQLESDGSWTFVIPNPSPNARPMGGLARCTELLLLAEQSPTRLRIEAPGRKKPKDAEATYLEKIIASLGSDVVIELPSKW